MFTRRALLQLGLALPGAAVASRTGLSASWPQWEAYAAAFIQRDGRVIDDQHATRYTTSEGQAYSLFFALVAGDRTRFETLLDWTRDHLAGGDLGARLPGWRWGRHDDGQWGLVDANAASDADLWLAYALLEAGRLWCEPGWRRLGRRVLALSAEAEVVRAGGLTVLLPGPLGFRLDEDMVRLNPSYLVLPQLRRFAAEQPDGPWRDLASDTVPCVQGAAPRGLAPDWVRLRAGRWLPDSTAPDVGSYDAIRCYLWAGLTHAGDPLRAPLLASLRGMAGVIRARGGVPPQHVNVRDGTGSGTAPPGFAAALLPCFHALGGAAQAQAMAAIVNAARTARQGPAGALPDAVAPSARLLAQPDQPPTYYDQVLALFGTGFMARRYGFRADGSLWTVWRS